MKPKEFAAAVIVAMISLCGVLGAALIYNWTDLFPAQATSTPQVVSLPAAPTIHVPDVVTVPATPTTYVPEIIFLPPTSTETALPTPTEVPEFNLFDHAQYATWTSNDDNNKTAPWMSMTYKIFSPTADICYDRLEDGRDHPKTIFTHPAWKDDGYVQGDFKVPTIGKGQHFLADVGFWYGAQSPTERNSGDGVEIYVFFQGDLIFRRIKYNTASLLPIDVDMAKYEGVPGTLTIKVTANGGSGQDQFCWVNPRIAIP